MRIKNRFMLGTDRQRAMLESVKRLYNHRTMRLRRRVAQELKASGLDIPRDRGFLKLEPGQFPEVSEIVRDAEHRTSESVRMRAPQPKTTTHGLTVHLLRHQELSLQSPYLRFVLQPQIIEPIIHYLGVVPVLAQIDVWYSEHAPSVNNSQIYHCDWSASSQIKIFLHCSDIGADNGPLTVIEADTSAHIRRMLKYNYVRNGDRYRVSDEIMRHQGGLAHEHALVGSAGTVQLVDTSRCFHYGSRVIKGAAPRIIALFQLVAPTAFQVPLKFQQGAPLKRLATHDLSKIQRLVLGAE